MKVGYARVSSLGQSLDTQIEKLMAFDCEKIFQQKRSGATREKREAVNEALEYCREGDVLVITKLDRLARSMSDLQDISKILDRKGVDFIVLDQSIDTTTNITDTNDTTFDFDAEIGGMKPAQDAMRKSVVRWNERVESYRDAKGASADLPKDAFKHHPAFDVLKSLFQTIWHEDEDEMSDYTLNVLTNISVGSDGLPRFDGLTRKAFSKITQSAEGMRDVAYKKGDFLMTSIAENSFQSYSYLDCLLWEAEPIAELPVAIGIREAVY